MKESLLARILRYGVYLAAFVALVIFSQFISPFHFGKVVVFRSLVELMLPFYLLLVWRDRSYFAKPTKIFWAFLFFTLAFTLTTVTSFASNQSFWGTLERMGGLWTFWHYFVFFVIATGVLRTRQQWERFLELTVFVGLLSALYGFGQKTDISFFIGSGGRERIFGTIGNPALFAGYQLLCLFLALTLLRRPQLASWKKKVLMVVAALNAIAVLMTAVRGSILALVVGLGVWLFLLTWLHESRRAKNVLIAFTMALALFFVVSFFFRDSALFQKSNYLRRITDVSPQTFTVKTRFWAWRAGLEGWSESFKTVLVGWGPENFNYPFSRHFNPKFFTGLGSETLFDRAHNMFVEVLVTLGLIGFMAYLYVFFAAFRVLARLIRSHSEYMLYGIGLIPLLIAYIIHNSFIFDTSANFITFFSVLGFISFLSGTQRETVQKPKRNLSLLQVMTTAALVVIAVIAVYRTNIVSAKANYATTRGIILGWQNDFKNSVAKYREAIAYGTPGTYEYRNRFAQYLLEYSTSKKLTPEIVSVLEIGIAEEKKSIEENPYDYLPELYLSRLYLILGKDDPKSPYNDEALKHSLKALSYSETFIRTYYEIGQGYLNKEDYDKAAEYFRKAVELNPDVGVSHWYLSMVEIERGNTKAGLQSAQDAFARGYVPSEQDYLRLVSIYIKLNDIPNAVLVYERLIALVPNNPDYRAALAAGYVRIGRIDDAVIQARKAAEIDPSFLEDAKSFVESLGRQW